MNNENRQHCVQIAETLEQIANGQMYRCPECGEFIHESQFDAAEGEPVCPCCKAEEITFDDCEQVSFFDYFTDNVLDVEYRLNAERQFKSVRLMVACGGPNAFIDTGACEVQLYWWTDRESCPIDPEACDAINECLEELYSR